MTTEEVITLARKHLGEGEMASSAQLCYDDAIEGLQYDERNRAYAKARALRSLEFSVGRFHPDYVRASE